MGGSSLEEPSTCPPPVHFFIEGGKGHGKEEERNMRGRGTHATALAMESPPLPHLPPRKTDPQFHIFFLCTNKTDLSIPTVQFLLNSLRVLGNWAYYPYYCLFAESMQLQDLLIFATGMNSVPALGFAPEPTIKFKHPDDCAPEDQAKDFPYANTCTNTLVLPVLFSYDQFSENLVAAITMAKTFTDA